MDALCECIVYKLLAVLYDHNLQSASYLRRILPVTLISIYTEELYVTGPRNVWHKHSSRVEVTAPQQFLVFTLVYLTENGQMSAFLLPWV